MMLTGEQNSSSEFPLGVDGAGKEVSSAQTA
jgi:hypothetical protein